MPTFRRNIAELQTSEVALTGPAFALESAQNRCRFITAVLPPTGTALLFHSKGEPSQASVAHAYNLSYLEDSDRAACGSRPARTKSS
jgi:hypothetical protein